MVRGIFAQGQSGRSVKLTTHLPTDVKNEINYTSTPALRASMPVQGQIYFCIVLSEAGTRITTIISISIASVN